MIEANEEWQEMSEEEEGAVVIAERTEADAPPPQSRRAAPNYPLYNRNGGEGRGRGNRSSSRRDDTTVMQMFARLRGPRELLRGNDDNSLRDHLVMLHTPLVEHCARNFISSGEPLDDLLQEGYVGLIKAVDRFDPDKGVRFSTYACHLITGEIRHYLRDLGKLIHEPGWHSELRQRIARTNENLTQKLGRLPLPEEIAETLSVRPETVRDVLKNQQILMVDSLDTSESDSDDDGGSIGDEFASGAEPQEPLVDNRLMLGAALPQLRDLEKQAVHLFFFEDCSKTEVARRLDISVNYAAYLIKQGTQHLRQIIERSDETVVATPRQKRAAYLLAMVKRAAQGKPGKKEMRVETSGNLALTTQFAEFAERIDDEVERATRYGHEFSLLWFHVRNWQSATKRLDAKARERVLSEASRLARDCCRTVDHIAVVPEGALSNLHILTLLPHTAHGAELVGLRLMNACQAHIIYPANSTAIDVLESEFALVTFPKEASSTEALFRYLGSQLKL